MFWSKHLLDSYCQQQHTTSLGSAWVDLHDVVNGTARRLVIRNVLQALGLKATVRVETGSSAAAGITQTLGAGRVRHLEAEVLWIHEKVKSHELKVSRVKSEDNRADMLTKCLDPERHHNLIEQLPLSVPGTGCGWAYSVALGVVCSLLPGRPAASNQIETVRKDRRDVKSGRMPSQEVKNRC